MLRLDNIHITLNKNSQLERNILNNVNLNIKPEEFVVIIGGNGAGKSTLFDIISGFITPDLGKIYLSQEEITQSSSLYRSKLISKVMQDPKLGTIENMSILENMAFAFKRGQKRGFHLFSNQKRLVLFKEKLSLLNIGLENRLHDSVSNLSGGQRQALSIMMAMLQDTKILLLDEITAALDPTSSEATMSLTYNIIKKQKQTCLMVTHNMHHALQYGDRILVLKNGQFIKEYDSIAKSRITADKLALDI